MRRAPVLLGLVLAGASAARAHPLAPALLQLREGADGRVEVTWKTPLLRPRGTAPEPVLPSRCRPVTPPTAVPDATGVLVRWTVACGPGSLVGERVGVAGLRRDAPGAVVRVEVADGRVVEGVVFAGEPSLTIPERPSARRVVAGYVRLGVTHILGGPDHLLFVLGLVLLGGTWRRLLGTLTAFTVGHSITLALAVLGVVTVPTGPIEAAIAASVFVLAVEVARPPGTATVIRRHPWTMALAFGLLHGLGFAAALREAGLPAGDIPLALLSFNLGIEAGQVLFVLAVVLVGRALGRGRARLPALLRLAPRYAMGVLAAFWWLERTVALLR